MHPSNEAMIDFWFVSNKATFDQLLNIPGVLRVFLVSVLTPPCDLANQLLLRCSVCSLFDEQLSISVADIHNRSHSVGVRPGFLHFMVNLHTGKEMFPQLSLISWQADVSENYHYPRGKTDVNQLKCLSGSLQISTYVMIPLHISFALRHRKQFQLTWRQNSVFPHWNLQPLWHCEMDMFCIWDYHWKPLKLRTQLFIKLQLYSSGTIHIA